MTVTGVIPAIAHGNIEMVPIGYTIEKGVRQFRPLSRIVVEGLVNAGVDHIIIVINEHKADLIQYYRDGIDEYGVPITYVWHKGNGIEGAINSTYHLSSTSINIMGVPGILDMNYIQYVSEQHITNEADLTLLVSQNTKTDRRCNITEVKDGQMSGIFVWSPTFSSYLRQYMADHSENRIQPTLDETIMQAIKDGLSVRGLKLPHIPFVQDAESWSKLVSITISGIPISSPGIIVKIDKEQEEEKVIGESVDNQLIQRFMQKHATVLRQKQLRQSSTDRVSPVQ